MGHKINAYASNQWITEAASRFISHRIGNAKRKETNSSSNTIKLGMQHKKPTVHSMQYKHWHKTEEVCQVEVVAEAKSQPPVTNQTPLMHLYGRHPRRHPTSSNPPSSIAKQATNSQNDHRMHRAMREENKQTNASLDDFHQPREQCRVTNR